MNDRRSILKALLFAPALLVPKKLTAKKPSITLRSGGAIHNADIVGVGVNVEGPNAMIHGCNLQNSEIAVTQASDVQWRKVPLHHVQTLEGLACFNDPAPKTMYYKTRWSFHTREEAINFVRTLYPRLVSVGINRNERSGVMSHLTSGYRNAVRYQIRGDINSTTFDIVSKKSDDDFVPVDIGKPGIFLSCNEAWMYLSNIRVNGEPVCRQPAPKRISEYVTFPFIAGKRAGTKVFEQL